MRKTHFLEIITIFFLIILLFPNPTQANIELQTSGSDYILTIATKDTSFITTELRELLILWNYNDLSCRKIKEHLRENGIDLKNIGDKLEELNTIIKNSLRTRPKFEYTFQKIVNNLTFLF